MDEARVIRAERSQLRLEVIDLEALLAADHRARIVWEFVESLNLSALYDAIKSREGEAGRPAADPKVLMALWLYATIEGVGSARELARLVERDVAYRWLAGGVSVNHHGLSDFRTLHVEILDRLLSESVTALIAEGLVRLEEIALDGTKIRASAGKGSFASGERLCRIEAAVNERLAVLKAEIESATDASARRKRAARERAAKETLERAAKAKEALERLRAEKAKRKEKHPGEEAKKKASEPRVSMTDPEARQMRFADGSVHAAYNAQVGADVQSGIVVTVAMTDRRNDSGLARPMVEDIARRYGRTMKHLLIDTHYATAEDIEALAADEYGGIKVYAPPPKEKDESQLCDKRSAANRQAQREKESDTLKDWRARMDTSAGQDAYRRRKRIELVHAQLKNRGFGILNVRGLVKARAVALWHALAHNLLTARRLREALA
jgi:transposase